MSDYILDEIDSGILNLLQRDGEITYKELAGKLKRSKSNIVERIKNLKTGGFIDDIIPDSKDGLFINTRAVLKF